MYNIAVTGHRPKKLGGYDAHDNFRAIRRHMREFLQAQKEDITLISGGALGIDQFWIEVGIYLKLPVIAALPFKGYNAYWPIKSRQEYQSLLDKCSEVRYICEYGYDPHKLQIRNEWMVDNCDQLVAYCNDSSSGTKNCIDYAMSQNVVINKFNPDKIIQNAKNTTT